MKKHDYINAMDSIKLSEDKKKTLKQRIIERFHNLHTKQKKPLRAVLAISLTLFMVAGIIFIPISLSKKPVDINPAESNLCVDNNSSQNDTSEVTNNEPTVNNNGIPDWYEPGKLVIKTISKNSLGLLSAKPNTKKINLVTQASEKQLTTISQSTDITLPEGMEFSGSLNATLLEVTVSSGEHAGCKNVFYNTETNETICLTHLFKNVIKKSGVNYDTYSLIKYNSDLTKAIYDTQIYGNSGEFVLFDIVNNTIREIPTPDNCVMSIFVTPDYKYAFYHATSPKPFCDDVFQVDLNTFKTSCISKVNEEQYYMSMGDWLYQTANGNILYFRLRSETDRIAVGSNARWVIYNANKQTAYLLNGDIIRFANNDHIVAVKTSEGVKFFDTDTGEEINGTEEIQNYEGYYVDVKDKTKTPSTSLGTITLVPYLDETKDIITIAEDVSCYLIEDDYIYTYLDDADCVNIYSLVNLESFTVKINENFVNAVKSQKKNYKVNIYFTINHSKTQALLYYMTSKKDTFDEQIPTIQLIDETFPEATCLNDLHDMIYEYSSYKLGSAHDGYVEGEKDDTSCEMYKGEGFNCLIVYEESGYTLGLVEDYRDNTFTMYRMGEQTDSTVEFYIYGGFDICIYQDSKFSSKYCRVKLNSSATSEKTLETFNFLTVEQAFVDFAEFYEGDNLDYDKIFNYANSTENILKHIDVAYIYNIKNHPGDGYDIINMDLFKELLQVSFDQDLKEYSRDQRVSIFGAMLNDQKSAVYKIECQVKTKKDNYGSTFLYFAIGKLNNGKKYVNYNCRFAYIDDATYNRLCEICNQLYNR